MKTRRIISFVLAFVFVAALTPFAVFSSSQTENPAINPGVRVLQSGVNTADAATVWYGDSAWRVIGYYMGNESAGVASLGNTITLFASDNMDHTCFDDGSNGCTNQYDGSTLKSKIDDIAAGFSPLERAAIKKRTLAKGTYNGLDTDCIAGDADLADQLLWPLSAKEANALDRTLGQTDTEHSDWTSSYW